MTQYLWQDRAACRNEDPELFFPVGRPGNPAYDTQTAAAIAVCKQCPVITQCESYRNSAYGIYGGRPELQNVRAFAV